MKELCDPCSEPGTGLTGHPCSFAICYPGGSMLAVGASMSWKNDRLVSVLKAAAAAEPTTSVFPALRSSMARCFSMHGPMHAEGPA